MAKINQLKKENASKKVPIAINAAKHNVNVDSEARVYAKKPIKNAA